MSCSVVENPEATRPSVVECAINPAPLFAINATERFGIAVSSAAIAHADNRCSNQSLFDDPLATPLPLLAGNLSIHPNAPAGAVGGDPVAEQPTSASRDANVASGVLAGAAALMLLVVGDSTAVEVQLLVLLTQAPAAASAWDRQTTEVLRYFVAPFAFAGDMEAVIGNVAIAVGVFVLHGLVVLMYYANRRRNGGGSRHDKETESAKLSCARLLFPAAPLAIAQAAFVGVLAHAFNAFNYGSATEAAVSGAIGIPFAIAVPSAVAFISWRVPAVYKLTHDDRSGEGTRGDGAQNIDNKYEVSAGNGFEETALPSATVLGSGRGVPLAKLRAAFLPRGQWGGPTEHRLIVATHGRYHGEGNRFAGPLTPLAVLFIATFFLNAIPPSAMGATARYAVVLVLCVLSLCGAVARRPFRAQATNALSAAAFASLSLLCVAQIVAESADIGGDSSRAFRLAAMFMVILFTLARAVHNAMIALCFDAPPQQQLGDGAKTSETLVVVVVSPRDTQSPKQLVISSLPEGVDEENTPAEDCENTEGRARAEKKTFVKVTLVDAPTSVNNKKRISDATIVVCEANGDATLQQEESDIAEIELRPLPQTTTALSESIPAAIPIEGWPAVFR